MCDAWLQWIIRSCHLYAEPPHRDTTDTDRQTDRQTDSASPISACSVSRVQGLAMRLLATLESAPLPALIQCHSNYRASAVAMLYIATHPPADSDISGPGSLKGWMSVDDAMKWAKEHNLPFLEPDKEHLVQWVKVSLLIVGGKESGYVRGLCVCVCVCVCVRTSWLPARWI